MPTAGRPPSASASETYSLLLKVRSKGGSGGDSNDWDTPLSKQEEEARSTEFGKAYDHLTFESEETPIKTLIGRTYREFSSASRSVTTLRLEKMRTEADAHRSRRAGGEAEGAQIYCTGRRV